MLEVLADIRQSRSDASDLSDVSDSFEFSPTVNFGGNTVIILGITGGIATGKSTLTQMFADLGAPIVSADAIARELLAPGSPLTNAVATEFPTSIVPDVQPTTIDRRALGRLVFADDGARRRLESLTHPPIIAELKRRIDALRPQPEPPAAAIEIPLLFEAGLSGIVDRVVVAACDDELQLSRLQQRLVISRVEAEQQIATQMPLSVKVTAADYVIDTGTSLEETRAQVRKIWAEVVG